MFILLVGIYFINSNSLYYKDLSNGIYGDLHSATLMFVYMNDYLRKVMNNVGILAIDKHIDEFRENIQENILKKVI